ncbi:uncharacterized protein LOC143865555 [Tasmannia lanceolata]|uniref:uncharacterized protein LOC143865555 n=1 Tax=Tasmannia lanceolata TaxID=3420 RepID=UPI004062E06D
MVVALGPGKFYGSSLPRPRFYTDVKLNDERVDPPLPVLHPFLSWAADAHWSMGGLSFKRHRLQGRIEGNVKRLRAQREKTTKTKINSNSLSPSHSPPQVNKKKRRLVLLDDGDDDSFTSEEEEEQNQRSLLKKNSHELTDKASSASGDHLKDTIASRTRSQRNGKEEMTRVKDLKSTGEVKVSAKKKSSKKKITTVKGH